nr:NADH-quinone oxidoreductase subunit C [Novosphingobium piscinae]
MVDRITAALGAQLVAAREEYGETVLDVQRDGIVAALTTLRDAFAYQQLMEIAGADYPARAERFEVVYMLLSVTRNHRVIVKVRAAEDTPVPSVTGIWPNAGWLEREVFDMYGVIFAGNTDLRRILTDYGFEGHPFRKDFPLTGYVELRYSEEDKRVVYEPVKLAQDLRTFDFMSPWEGTDYVLPGDEKAATPPAPVAPAPVPAAKAEVPKTTDKPADTAAGDKASAEAAKPARVRKSKAVEASAPTEARPARKPRAKKAAGEGGQGPAPEGS